MTDADVIYYRWLDWPLLVMLALLAAGAVVLVVYDLRIGVAGFRMLGQSAVTRWAFRSALIATSILGFAYIIYAMKGFNHDIAALVINKDYVSCVSWREPDGRFMRVPWDSFTNISRVYSGRRSEEPNLRFDLDRSRAKNFPWTEYIRDQGWVLCHIRGLTDNPRQIAFPTGTDEILSRASDAWRAAKTR